MGSEVPIEVSEVVTPVSVMRRVVTEQEKLVTRLKQIGTPSSVVRRQEHELEVARQILKREIGRG